MTNDALCAIDVTGGYRFKQRADLFLGDRENLRQSLLTLGILSVAYPGWFFGCPETPSPGHDCFNQGRDTLAGTDLH